MIGWRGALPAFLAKEAAYARGCARQASLPCRLLVGAHAERRMSAVQRRASPTKAALATLSGSLLPAAAAMAPLVHVVALDPRSMPATPKRACMSCSS